MAQPLMARRVAFTTLRQDWITALLSLWMIAGIAIDGWAHVSRGGVESFFTPWHAIFYSGYLAVAGWILYLVRSPVTGSGSPSGYRLGLSGLAIFAGGAIGDLLWHQFLGIEVSIDALISPTHLILLTGAMLIISSPIRAGWHRPSDRRGGWGWQGPALLAVTLVAVLAQFFFLYAAGWTSPAFVSDWNPAGGDNFGVALGMLSLLTSTLILTTALLFTLRRWDPAPGFAALLVGSMGLSMAVVHGADHLSTTLAAVLGGVAADGTLRQLRPSPGNPVMARATGFLVPVGVWTVYVIMLAIRGVMRWPAVLWIGAILMMGLVGLGLSLLGFPPREPAASN